MYIPAIIQHEYSFFSYSVMSNQIQSESIDELRIRSCQYSNCPVIFNTLSQLFCLFK